jgi:long-chain acyl-CoA synthetase
MRGTEQPSAAQSIPEPLHPGVHARRTPDRPAIVMGRSGTIVSYAELEARSRRVSRMFRARGLAIGSHIAILMDNNERFLEVAWAAQRAGLYFTPINWHLGLDEIVHVVADCGARLIVASGAVAELAGGLRARLPGIEHLIACGGDVPGYEDYEAALAAFPAEPIADETEGAPMYYSSGTTGYPKGIKRALTGAPFGTPGALDGLLRRSYDFGPETIYLCPGPLYHAAPLNFSLVTQRLGGTVVVMEKFDAESTLSLIERHRISHAQFVPTHFVRLLRLPDETRARYDLSSLRYAIHAGAPCAPEVKEAMIASWGPKIHEYYAGSEVNGFCMIDTHEWLAHRGSVGRSVLGPVHIVAPDGSELPPREQGLVYFEGMPPFEYHNAPEKTAEAFHAKGWSTLGDIGYLDGDGFLYLTDRRSHTIISGGVNIYPQEIENALTLHPAVRDVAVIGVPNVEFGEEVKAVVELLPGHSPGEQLARDLIDYCRARIAHYKCPRSVDFVASLPRLPNGKLLKRELRKRYPA